MDKIFTAIRNWLGSLLVADTAADPLDQLTVREFADLPTVHPAR